LVDRICEAPVPPPVSPRLTEMLGAQYPIVAFSHCRDVVAAVTRAGGFGVLGAVAFPPEILDRELTWIDGEVGDRAYGVDILLPAAYEGRERGGLDVGSATGLLPEEHRAFVRDLLERYGVPPLPGGGTNHPGAHPGATLLRASERGGRDLVDVALGHPKVRLVANALGPAPDWLVETAHGRGLLVAGLVGTVEHARRQRVAGVDVVVAQGYEAGGHTGTVSTMVLVPQVVDAVAPVPVLAAGGIADGRQVAAALALGAKGVWCGSVWLTTREAETHPVVVEKMLAADSTQTVRSRSLTGKPARQLESAWTREWDDSSHPDPLPLPLQGVLVAEAQARIGRSAATTPGSRELVNYFVGQVVGQMDAVRPARQVVQDMVEGYVDTIAELARAVEEEDGPGA